MDSLKGPRESQSMCMQSESFIPKVEKTSSIPRDGNDPQSMIKTIFLCKNETPRDKEMADEVAE